MVLGTAVLGKIVVVDGNDGILMIQDSLATRLATTLIFLMGTLSWNA